MQYYDKVAELTGCSGNGSLACLRKVPTAKLTAAIDQTPSLFAYQSCVPVIDPHSIAPAHIFRLIFLQLKSRLGAPR